MKNHVIELDYARALAIIIIVVCHLHEFIKSDFLERWSAFPIAFVGLNMFFMLSGFLLNSNRKIDSIAETIAYIKKRVRRIYPLYWLAFVLFIIFDLVGINNVGTIRNTKMVFLCIMGLQALSQQYSIYGTWFVGVIILYYIVYIFIGYNSKSINDVIIKSIFIMIPFVLLRVEFGLIHSNFFVYYLVFVGGVIAAKIKNLKGFLNASVYFVMIILLLCIVYFLGYLQIKTFLSILIYPMFSFICTLFGFVYGIYRSKQTYANRFLKNQYAIVSIIAYSSYSIFLFHSSVLTLTMLILNKVGIYSGFLYDFLILAIGIPLVFFVGYYIPKVSKL